MIFSRCTLVCLVLSLCSSNVLAVDLQLELELIASDDPVNVLTLTVGSSNFLVGRDTEKAELSGTILADVEIDFESGEPLPLFMTLTGGFVEATDVEFNLAGGFLSADATGLGGVPGTDIPPGSIVDGEFSAEEHMLTLNQGEVFAAGESIDFAEMPLSANGLGSGSLSFMPVGAAVDNVQEFDVRIEFPVMIDDTFPVDNVPIFGSIDLDVMAEGVMIAIDRVMIELPTSSLFACDVDSDGDVDAADRTVQTTNWTGALQGEGTKLPSDGDCDLDGDVDAADVTILVGEWTGASMASGVTSDFTNASTLHQPVSHTVPEPGGHLLALSALLGLSLRRKVMRSVRLS